MGGIELKIDAGVAWIVIDRPPVNVLNNDSLLGLAEAFETVASDDAVRIVRVEARGKLFSAGVDVGDHLGEKVDVMMDRLLRLFEAIERTPQPIVAKIHGAALGGGCELIAALDLCYAATSAKLGQPEIKLGLFAPPASVLLPRLLGERRAADLLLRGEPIDAATAASWGLINEAVEADALDARVDDVCEQLLALSGSALRQAKAALRLGQRGDLVDAYRAVDRQYRSELMKQDDAHEGLASFMEKRTPNWSHR